ncbi:MAG: Holliday junction branch migration protein RuvA [Candidatus Nealsonbacteria bacterium]|nr:Holliday junction branch migration protein RuvA [Candidatus Nealsonbacteria bacterium]
MIYFLEGKPVLKGNNFIVLEVNGLGYKVFLSANNLQRVEESEKAIKLFTSLRLKEDALELYGFLNQKELGLFETLNEVQGIGPKAALVLSSVGSPEDFRKAIEEGDAKFFAGIKGIGAKKIQKIILELTGRFKELKKEDNKETDDALDVLISLGFSRQKAKEALDKVSLETKEADQRVKEALKILR